MVLRFFNPAKRDERAYEELQATNTGIKIPDCDVVDSTHKSKTSIVLLQSSVVKLEKILHLQISI
jgi:hypothetical protein